MCALIASNFSKKLENHWKWKYKLKIHGEYPTDKPRASIFEPYDPNKKPVVLGPKNFKLCNKKPGDIYCSEQSPIENDKRLRSFHDVLQKELSKIESHGVPHYAAVVRQKDRASKKMEVSASADALDYLARKNFRELNSSILANPIDLSPDIVRDARLFIESALERYTKSVNEESVQQVLDIDHLVTLWRFGPGASRGTEARHFVDKLCIERPTVTENCAQLAKLIRLKNHRLLVIDQKSTEGHPMDDSPVEFYDWYFTVVPGSSLSTVTKNEDTRRTIATEPLMNMAAQLCAGAYIEGALRCVGLDISKQADLNQALAWRGSLDGSIATLDLKNASDLIQLLLIQLLWPSVWYELFIACRSPECKIDTESDVYTELNMMSTMGNGFTFPMMTLTLLALVYAVQSKRLNKPMFIDYANTGVFGDDIIVPKEDYNAIVHVLADAGLMVNTDKSYNQGSFRESCGGDFANGYNITPFYVKSLRTDPQVYSAINQLSKWCCYHEIYLHDTLAILRDMLEQPDDPIYVPFWEDPSSGIQTKTVRTRYKLWEPVPFNKYRNMDREIPEMLLLVLIGGYADSFGNFIEYTTEIPTHGMDFCTPYKLCSARLPKGYLDGGTGSDNADIEEGITYLHWISDLRWRQKISSEPALSAS